MSPTDALALCSFAPLFPSSTSTSSFFRFSLFFFFFFSSLLQLSFSRFSVAPIPIKGKAILLIKNDVIIFERRRKKRNADFSCGVENTHENKRARYDRSAIILFFRIHGFTIKKRGGCPPSFVVVGVLRLGRNETKNEGRRIKEVNTTATSQVGGCGAAASGKRTKRSEEKRLRTNNRPNDKDEEKILARGRRILVRCPSGSA